MGGLFSQVQAYPELDSRTQKQHETLKTNCPTCMPSLEELLIDVSPEKLDQPCTDEHLNEIALSVTEWQSVSPFLKLMKAEQEEIERDCRGTRAQRIEMLRRWREKARRQATYRKLAEVFYRVEQAVLVEKLCELLQESESSSEYFDAEENLPGTSPPQLSPNEDVQEVTPHRLENPVLAAYACYLRRRYVAVNPAFLTLQWPPPPTRKVFNLAMILQTTVRYDPIDEVLVQLTLKGNVDDIMHRKVHVKLEKIFELDEAERKLILIEGAPGAGKSTLAWHIPHEWAQGKLFQNFEVIVFIQLRDPEVQAAQSLADLLPAKDRATAEIMAGELCKSEGLHILFILDSWDEFSLQLQSGSIFERLICYPERLNLHLSAMLITSRPISSGILYPHISSRVEIVGFTPTERKQYFIEVLKGDSQKVQKLQDHMNECPVVEASCYLPLNAAIVVHLFLALNQTLPNTLHGVFTSLVICCLIRHVRRERKEEELDLPDTPSFEDLPVDIQQPLKNICILAYHGIMKNKVTFSASDLQSFSLPTELSTLSLIQGMESFTAFGNKRRSYCFLHLSIQELLAAFHISKLPESEQTCIFKELFGKPRFAAVFQYYATFTKLQAEGVRDIIANIVKNKKGNWKTLLVSLLQCLYEAQDLSLCQFVASQLIGELNLSKNSLSPVDCLAMGYFLRSVCLTTSGEFKVNLRECSLDDYRVSFLVKGLSKSSSSSDVMIKATTDGCVPGFLNLDLSRNKMYGRGAECIAQVLFQCSLIRKLHLSKNPLSDSNKLQAEDGICHLLQALVTNSSLMDLSLNKCSFSISKENGPVLAQMLQTNKTLTFLNLSGSNVSDVCAFYLAEGLKQNTRLEKLFVIRCSITGKCAQFLSEALVVNTSLVSLNIGDNDLGDDGIAHISYSLTLNTTLRELYLNDCKLTEKGSDLLAQALKVNKSLSVLNIMKNSISDSGATHIANALKHNQSLKELDISVCEITDQGAESLAIALTVNSTLAVLNLSYNQFTNAGLVALGDCLKNNRGLQTLLLRYHMKQVTVEGLKHFVLCLQENWHLTKLGVCKSAGGTKIVQHETELVNETRRQKGLPELVVSSLRTVHLEMTG